MPRSWILLAVTLCCLPGCGTTRQSDTQRTATEQLLISNAVDQAVAHVDFSPLAGKSVFFDPQYFDNTVDKGYVISSIRQQLLAHGCTLQEERSRAAYVVEARAGGVGTDRHSVLVGIPEMTVPTILPGQPSHIPEVPFARLSGKNLSCKEIGGDFYDAVNTADGLAIVLADVAGKGVSAALLASTLQWMIYSQLVARMPLTDIVDGANRFLTSKRIGEKYATLIIAPLRHDGELEFVNCGHIPPLLVC